MSTKKKILIGMACVFIAMQFIRPARNNNRELTSRDIVKHYNVPTDVMRILQTSCYDCHSNITQYPWYTNIQPIGSFLANHITQGKAALNFSEFGSYSERRQLNKLRSMKNSITDGTMPLHSYTFLHRNAKLSDEQKTIAIRWIENAIDSSYIPNP